MWTYLLLLLVLDSSVWNMKRVSHLQLVLGWECSGSGQQHSLSNKSEKQLRGTPTGQV